MTNLAPIVLLVYNRPWHTERTIEALRNNELARYSELFIFSDGPKPGNEKEVFEVRKFIRDIKGFKNITIIEREYNWGLADNIIDGITRIVNKYGKVIVLEDDLVTSPYFLKYMNEALSFYEKEKRVWHISGWNYPIGLTDEKRTFLWRVMNCWGWGTWADRWKFFNRDIEYIMNKFSKKDIFRFNLDGTENFWGQIIANKKGKIRTWAIFWYATIFLNRGLCLNPVVSFVRNIGLDGSGVHCGKQKDNDKLNMSVIFEFPLDVKEDKYMVNLIKSYLKNRKPPLFVRGFRKLLRMFQKEGK